MRVYWRSRARAGRTIPGLSFHLVTGTALNLADDHQLTTSVTLSFEQLHDLESIIYTVMAHLSLKEPSFHNSHSTLL